MNKNIIKKYANCINEEMIRKYADKESINLSELEVETILYIIRNELDEIIESKTLNIVDKYKNSLSKETIEIITSLFEKYKNFID